MIQIAPSKNTDTVRFDLLTVSDKMQTDLEHETGEINSSFFETLRGSVLEGIVDIASPDKLSPEMANERFGVEGKLEFQSPVSEFTARRRRQKVERRSAINSFLEVARDQDEGFLNKASNLLMVISAGAPEQVALTAGAVGFGGPLLAGSALATNALSKAPILQAALRNPLSRGAIFGALEEVPFLPARKAVYESFGEEYTAFEAALDVGISSGIGIGAEVLPSIFTGVAAAKKTSKSGQVKDIMKKQLSPETRDIASQYVKNKTAVGEEISFSTIEDVMRLSEKSTPVKGREGGFLNEYVLRTDFDSIPTTERPHAVASFARKKLIDEVDIITPKRLIDPKVPKPLDLDRLAKKVKSGLVTAGDFSKIIKSSKQISLDDQGAIKAARKILGKKISAQTKLTPAEALNVYDELYRSQRRLDLETVDLEETLTSLQELQRELKKKQINADVQSKSFKKGFKKAKAKVEAIPGLKDTEIEELFGLPKDQQEALIDYLRYFQESNLDNDLAVRALGGEAGALDEMQSSIEFNRRIKDDGGTKEEVFDRLHKELESEVSDINDIPPVEDLVELPPVKVQLDESLNRSLASIEENISLLESQFDPEDLVTIQKDLKPGDDLLDSQLDAILATIDCLLG